MTVPVYTLDPLQDPRWPEFLERHPDASVFHSRSWLEALRRTYGYEPVAYTTSPLGADLGNGVVFCRVHSWLTGRRLVSLPFSDHCEPLADREGDLEDLLAALRRDLRRESWKYVEIRPLLRVVEAPGFEKSAVFHAHRLDLRPPIEVLSRTLHKSCIRRKIRRAERENLTCEEGTSEALLRKFYQLLLVTCHRKQLPPQPLSWFRHLTESMGDRVKIRVVSQDGRPVASTITLSFKRTLVYKYGCSDGGFNRVGGTQLLLWRAIQEAKREGLDEFDLGRSDFDTPGLVAFKDRWGASRSVMTYLRCSASPVHSFGRPRTMRLAQKCFARMPDNLLIAAGEMFYRHVG